MKTDVEQGIEKNDELVIPPPQQQADNNTAAGNASNQERDQNNDQGINEKLTKTLYKAALEDDWETAHKKVFNRDPAKNSKYLTATISDKSDTALHIAVAAESFFFARRLVRYMKKDDLAIKNSDGDTAFFLVAEYGMVGVAKVMYRKNNDLPGIRGRGDQEMLPIHIAALYGHEEMTEFLREVTKGMTKQDTDKLDEYLREDLFEESDSATESESLESMDDDMTEPLVEGSDSATENELHPIMDEDMTELPADNENILKKLEKAASTNDWFTAYWEIFGKDRNQISQYATANLTENNDNALHIAAAAGSFTFISYLRKYMRAEDLEMQNADGNTAFYLAAKYGRFNCAELMLEINKELLVLRGDANEPSGDANEPSGDANEPSGDAKLLPIQIAAQQGHIKMVKFLYNAHCDANSLRRLSQEDCEQLLPNLICRADLIDIAWKLLKEHPQIVKYNIANGRRGQKTFLHILAQTHLISPELSNQNKEGLIQRFFNKWLRFKLVVKSMLGGKITVPHKNKCPHEKLPKQALHLLKLLLKKIDFSDDWMHEVIDVAVKHDNVEFLSLIICEYPKLMNCTVEGDRQTAAIIFSNAISKRQKDIFQLRERLNPSLQKQILDYKDAQENNILHLAGKLSPPEQLDATCGVALQMQQELAWFKEVSSMVDALKAREKNEDGKTPKALFDEEHKQLKERDEKWMKGTANSCMIVATLIATVVFAAAFTVPGGIDEESGMPRFANQLSFRTFVLADAISLVLSVYSLLIFLVISTSGYAEKDFYLKLPKLLLLGLLTLVLSVAAMMVVFCTGILIVFKVDIWVRILLSVGASLPVLHFVKMKARLLFNIAHKTCEINCISKRKAHSTER